MARRSLIAAASALGALAICGMPMVTSDHANVAAHSAAALWHPNSVPGLAAGELRSAYGAAALNRGSGTTVATVQFSGWHSSLLSTYAKAAGIPIASGQVRSISVNGAPTGTPTSRGGEIEVALDQELLLATAPKAHQLVYVTTNDQDGAIAAYHRIAADVLRYRITAVSLSWGLCEPWVDTAGWQAMEAELKTITALGATVFAASGDAGAYDCSTPDSPSSTLAVDYPASSRYVVAVGGTRLDPTSSGWNETGWSQPGSGSYKGDGSGGGVSRFAAVPRWQTKVSTTKRLVPDISAQSDPSTAPAIWAPDPSTGHPTWLYGGGTSAAAPIQAGLLADTVATMGRSLGVGELHDTLYAHPAAFRDVTSGSNHYWSATRGFDKVSGLGSPNWGALLGVLRARPVLLVSHAVRTLVVPTVVTPPLSFTPVRWVSGEAGTISCDTAGGTSVPPTSVTLSGSDRSTAIAVAAFSSTGECAWQESPTILDTHAPATTWGLTLGTGTATVRWSSTDPSPSSGVHFYVVRVYRNGTLVWSTTASKPGSATLTVASKAVYDVEVIARDAAGNRTDLDRSFTTL